jgi:hypothetical protein
MNNRQLVRGMLTVLWISCLAALAWAQDSGSPDPSLGQLARQTRAQRESNGGQPNKAQQLVDEMQREQEAELNAPTGFKSYNAGDYRLFVPFPYSLEGRDNGGAVLLGSSLGITNTEVLAGAPIPIPPNLSDNDLANLVRQVALRNSRSAYCSPTKLGPRKAFSCSMNTASLLGHEVWGTMEVVVASNSLIPVMCVSPDDMRQCLTYSNYGYQTCYKRYPSWDEVQQARKAIETRYQDERTTAQMCEQIIYPSIQLKEDIVVHPVTIAEGKEVRTAGPAAQDNSVAAYGQETPSLGELARNARQAPRAKAQAALDNPEGNSLAPPGFQSFALQYCHNPQHCLEASVVIPEKTEVVSRTNGQHIFKTFLSGDPVMLYAGPADVNAPYRSLTDADYIRMRDLANSNGWSHEKADAVSTQELTIEGRPALMTRFRYQRDQKTWWIGERALIQDKTEQFLLGCTSPEQRFAEAEALCTTLVNSLRLP